MKILGIETSVKIGSLALIEGENLIARSDIDTRLNHSARLIPVLNELLQTTGWGIDDLDGVGVGLGPGSFTGIRVGLAAGQGIAFGASIPLVGIGSLQAMVQGSSAPDGPVVTLLDAGRGRVYGAGYRKIGDDVEETIPPMLISSGEIEALCRSAWIVTPRWDEWKKEAEGWEIPGGENGIPQAQWVAILARKKLRNASIDEIETASPIYLSQYWKNQKKVSSNQ
jgi:tRNA threonylcarbamoyladenosine biosynthesis protein TsaB